MNKCCKGCGVLLQSENPSKIGYVENLDQKYCRRCFRMRNYHEFQKVTIPKGQESMLEKVNQSTGFAFFFCDFLNLYPDNIKCYHQIKIPKLFCVTKSDSIPESIYYENIRRWLQKTHHITEEILFISVKNVHKLKEKISRLPYQKIFFLGPTNAGKSSLVKALTNQSEITVSEMPNTTLNFIKVPYLEKQIYDTVGFADMYTLEDPTLIKKTILKKQIKPLILPVNESCNLLIEDFLRLAFDRKVQVTFFKSDLLKVQKVYSKNTSLLDTPSFTKDIKARSHIYLEGLGFFYLEKPCKITFYNITEEYINICESFFGGNHE